MTESQLKFVSSTIPTRNATDLLPLTFTFEFVLRQAYLPCRCTVVDAGSIDGIVLVVADRQKRDLRVQRLSQQHRGQPAKGKSGLPAVVRWQITFLAVHRVILKGSVNWCVGTLDTEPFGSVAGNYCGSIGIEEALGENSPNFRPQSPPPDVPSLTSIGDCPSNAKPPMLMTDLLSRISGSRDNLFQSAENRYLIRLLRNGSATYSTVIRNATRANVEMQGQLESTSEDTLRRLVIGS